MIKLDEVLCNCYIGLCRVLLFVNKCIYISLDSPREKKTITRFVTDWLQNYIGLINLKDGKADIGTALRCFGRGNPAQHNRVFCFSVECPFVEKRIYINFFLSLHRIIFVFTQQFWVEGHAIHNICLFPSRCCTLN